MRNKPYGPHPDRQSWIIVACLGLGGSALTPLGWVAERAHWPEWCQETLRGFGAGALVYAVIGYLILRHSTPPAGWDR